jgi:predicted CxxxxCH...CXXCH cytochrome family protein
MKWLVVITLLAACATEREQPVCADCSYTGIHPSGWLDPASDTFHGKDLARRGWDFPLCASCHSDDWKGKGNAPSCLRCHADGPTSCTTCHAQPPATGAHAAHVAQGVACDTCHVVPATWDAPGHILDPKPPVAFSGLATAHGATPSFDSGACSNAYCHGAAKPVWTGGSAQAACGTCHGNPPANHGQTECALCHQNAKHVDGNVDVATTCTGGCHGDATTPAPPRGVHGETLQSELAVGAHRAHLNGGVLRGPIACTECHAVPAAVSDAGHIDHAGPATVSFGSLASANGSTPTYDHASGTCSGVYCHLALTPVSWTGTASNSAYCGGCHGLPPTDQWHQPTMQLTDCATCHTATVGPFGNILVSNGKHINGVVDFQ